MADQNNRSLERLNKLVLTSARIFAKFGYNKTHMSKIAGDMDIAPGTLYLYVKSKKALFHFVLKRIFSDDEDLTHVVLPIKLSRKMTPVAMLEKMIEERHVFRYIEEAIDRKDVPDIEAEFDNILRNLYHTLSRYRYGIAIVMQSAEDYPDLAQFFYQRVREDLIDLLSKYLDSRIKMKLFKAVPDTSISARLIFETTNWFAVHKRGGPHPVHLDEKLCEETVVSALKNAFIEPQKTTRSRR